MISNEKLWQARIKPMPELCAGYLRYEAIRKLNADQYAEIFERNVRGENFDAMIDELIGGEK